MMVNGQPRWTCRTHVKKVLKDGQLTVAPLRNLPVIRDLAADMDPFFEKWIAAGGVHKPGRSRDDAIQQVRPEDPGRVEANKAIECINCAVCYASCDTVAGNPDYLGPAALQRARTLYKRRQGSGPRGGSRQRHRARGCTNCHSQGSCIRFLPE